MASALPKLLTRSSVTRIVSAFQLHNPYAPTLLESLASRPSPLVGIDPEFQQPASLSPGKEHPDLSTIIFPSFPFGFPVNPVSSNVCCSPESVDEEMDDSQTMWADSVKKKRKKEDEQTQIPETKKADAPTELGAALGELEFIWGQWTYPELADYLSIFLLGKTVVPLMGMRLGDGTFRIV